VDTHDKLRFISLFCSPDDSTFFNGSSSISSATASSIVSNTQPSLIKGGLRYRKPVKLGSSGLKQAAMDCGLRVKVDDELEASVGRAGTGSGSSSSAPSKTSAQVEGEALQSISPSDDMFIG